MHTDRFTRHISYYVCEESTRKVEKIQPFDNIDCADLKHDHSKDTPVIRIALGTVNNKLVKCIKNIGYACPPKLLQRDYLLGAEKIINWVTKRNLLFIQILPGI